MRMLKYPMPEAWYNINQNINYEELSRKFESNEFITGKITRWNSLKNHFEIDLGNNITGIMPIEETSIYPTLNSNGTLKPEAYCLVGKIICAKITDISSDTIILSRKRNMLDAFDIIRNFENEIINCYIKSAKEALIFIDVGHGILGLLHVKDLSTCIVNDVKDVGIKEKTFIKAKINFIDYSNSFINLGYKELYENVSDKYNHGDIIEVISFNPVQNTENGYFCYVNPNTSAILNGPFNTDIPYGSRIIAKVRSAKINKLKLSFLSFA